MHCTTAWFGAYEHDGKSVLDLQAIALDARCLRRRLPRRQQRYHRTARRDDRALQLFVLRWIGLPEPIADERDGRNAGRERAAMRRYIDPWRKPGDDRNLHARRKVVGKLCCARRGRTASDYRDAGIRQDAANI